MTARRWVALAALAALSAGLAQGGTQWPDLLVIIDDAGTQRLESGFSVDSLLDCPDVAADITAYQAGPGLLVITPDPGVGPPIIIRYGDRSWTDRIWPEMVPALVLTAYVGPDGARLDGGFAGSFEDCTLYTR
jgi:hypothetical protein